MRITIVCGFFLPVPPVSGGATEKIWYKLAKMFADAGHSVTIISRSWPGLAQDEMAEGIHHIRLAGFNHRRLLSINLALDFIWGIRVSRVLPAGDAIVCNTVALPVWIHRFKPSSGIVAVMMGRAPKGQIRLYGNVARVFAPSSYIADMVKAERKSISTLVTGNPIDWPLHAMSSSQTSPPVIVGFVGRLHPEKGLPLLIRAACLLVGRSQLPDWRLRIVGPYEIKAGGGGEAWIGELKAEAARTLEGRDEWLPPEYDAKRLAMIYGGMDLFCYPSLAEKGETFGVSVAEAMAAGCAVVVSSLRCFTDLVENDCTGLIFDHTAAEAEILLADCLSRLISDANVRKQLARNGQLHVKRFDYPEVSRCILADLALLTGSPAEKSR